MDVTEPSDRQPSALRSSNPPGGFQPSKHLGDYQILGRFDDDSSFCQPCFLFILLPHYQVATCPGLSRRTLDVVYMLASHPCSHRLQ